VCVSIPTPSTSIYRLEHRCENTPSTPGMQPGTTLMLVYPILGVGRPQGGPTRHVLSPSGWQVGP
jgi:hypothetical protein